MNATIDFDVLSPDYQGRLHDIYRALRDREPVYWHEKSKVWMLSRFDDVQAAMKDKERLKSSGTRQDVLPQLQATDGKRHSDLKMAVAPKFLAGALAHLEPEIRRVTCQVLDEAAARGGCELVHDVAHRIPKTVVPPFLGIHDRFLPALVELTDPLGGFDPQNPVYIRDTLYQEYSELISRILEARSAERGDDLISQLLALESNGDIDREGICIIIRTVLFAAFDTTINLIANGTVLLAESPDQRERLIADMGLLPGAILEMLRMESPAQVEPRRVAEPVVFQGKEIPAGDEIILLLGAANRDERHFRDADRFDVGRDPQDHLAFGFGMHKCVGRHLALMEARIYFEELLKRFPRYRIGETRWLVSNWSRAYAAVDFRCEG